LIATNEEHGDGDLLIIGHCGENRQEESLAAWG
jgi:hypothetical protein